MVGGAEKSAHLDRRGCDIRIWEYTEDEINKILTFLKQIHYLYVQREKDHIHFNVVYAYRDTNEPIV
jgi:hypothetical protein